MIRKLTDKMDDQEAIFFLKNNISGQAKKLTSSIEQYRDAMAILDNVYGNTDKVLQTRIADFIKLVTKDPSEKESCRTKSRSLDCYKNVMDLSDTTDCRM